MIIVDDHVAILAIAGAPPDIGRSGPIATTYGFHFKARPRCRRLRSFRHAVAPDRECAGRAHDGALRPPAHRLVILDPRATVGESVRMGVQHGANLLLAELVGAAVHHRAAVRVTPANEGRAWAAVMTAEGVDFATVEA